MPAGDWEKVQGRAWPYAGRAPIWPDDYPASCTCNPPSRSNEQINADGSFHSRTCSEHPGRRDAGHTTPIWPADYPPSCNCNPPAHEHEQIIADESFHSRTCPEHPGRRS